MKKSDIKVGAKLFVPPRSSNSAMMVEVLEVGVTQEVLAERAFRPHTSAAIYTKVEQIAVLRSSGEWEKIGGTDIILNRYLSPLADAEAVTERTRAEAAVRNERAELLEGAARGLSFTVDCPVDPKHLAKLPEFTLAALARIADHVHGAPPEDDDEPETADEIVSAWSYDDNSEAWWLIFEGFMTYVTDGMFTNVFRHPTQGLVWRVTYAGREWSISYNGGELMVGKVNSDELDVSIPLSTSGAPTNPNQAQVCFNVRSAILGSEIDYMERMSDSDARYIWESLTA